MLPQLVFRIFIDQQSSAWICTIEGLYQVKINPIRFKTRLNSDLVENEPIPVLSGDH